MRGDIVTVAVGLAVALAFSALIAAFTADIIRNSTERAGEAGDVMDVGGTIHSLPRRPGRTILHVIIRGTYGHTKRS